MNKIISTVAGLSLALLAWSPASAATITVEPGIYDPDNTGTAVAAWVTTGSSTVPMTKDDCKDGGWMNPAFDPAFRNQGQCVSAVATGRVGTNQANQVLSLQKNASTATNSAAGADIEGVGTTTLTELGFDYQGYCGAGAPRFNVYTTAGTYYFFGCTYGTHTDLGNGFTRVRFGNADAFPADGTTVFPGFGTTTVTGMEIVLDEGPAQVLLDNIDVNGTLVGGN